MDPKRRICDRKPCHSNTPQGAEGHTRTARSDAGLAMPDLRSDAVSPELPQGQGLASPGTACPRPGHDSLRGYPLKDTLPSLMQTLTLEPKEQLWKKHLSFSGEVHQRNVFPSK